MKFAGHLTVERDHLVEQMRFALPARVERDGFRVVSAVPLRGRHRLGWFHRLRTAMRIGGGALLLRQAREISIALPLSGSGQIGYTVDAPGIGRLLAALVLAITALAYFRESPTAAILAILFASALAAIGLHIWMRRSVETYLGLSRGQFAEHRLTMG